MSILVIRSARETVFREYLAATGAGTVTVLGQPGSVPEGVRLVPAPAGPMQWRRLPEQQRKALTSIDWSEVVILHNLGDDSYDDVIAIAVRVAPAATLCVHYADGVQHRYRSTLTFFAGRKLLATAAVLVAGLLMVAAFTRRLR